MRSFSQSNQEEKERKGIQIGKKKVNVSRFADDILLYVKEILNFTKKLLELIHKFGKTAGYKIKI